MIENSQIKKKYNQNLIDLGERGKYHIKNKLNDLTGKEWVKFTKSWFVHNPPPRKEKEILHPAKFPEPLIQRFLKFFTKKGNLVLDPFLGVGSTLLACALSNRKCIGIELIKKYSQIAEKRLNNVNKNYPKDDYRIYTMDAQEIDTLKLPKIDFCITSPPYWNMLKKSRGNVKSVSKQRKEKGLDSYYSEDNPKDIGNLKDINRYLNAIVEVFEKIYPILKKDKYIVVIMQNVRIKKGEMIPLAWKFALKMTGTYILKQEMIWCQDNKFLGCWGYPSEYVSNVHHHYCLVFQKKEKN